MPPAVQLTDVRKTYRSGEEEVVALDHATLEVAAGELTALVGPSGSGKTTLLSIAGALLGPSEGQVRVGGEDIAELSDRERTAFRGREIGFVFQAVNLVPFLTARENLLVVAEMNRSLDKVARERIDQLLDDLGLATGSGTGRASCPRSTRSSASRSWSSSVWRSSTAASAGSSSPTTRA